MECGTPLRELGSNNISDSALVRYNIPEHIAERVTRERQTIIGERKPVTVLFSDIKGSTALVEHLDPEVASEILGPSLQVMIDAVHRFDGTVSKVLGDGLLALFGAPLALEDHAVRACYAALAMQKGMRELSMELRRRHGIEVQVRIGLNSGEVVVLGVGTDLHVDYDAIGATVHLAARMEQLAPPGTVRLTSDTARLLGTRMDLEEVGPIAVSGFSERVSVYELRGVREVGRRGPEGPRDVPFVGRHSEVQIVTELATEAARGRGHTILITGEPGIGKSRLCTEVAHAMEKQGWLTLSAQAAPYEISEPWLPIRRLLREHFSVLEGHQAPERVTGVLDALKADLSAATAGLLDLIGAESASAQRDALKPAERRQQMMDAFRAWLIAESQRRPVLLLVDDVQWVDGKTKELLHDLAEFVGSAAILLVLSGRDTPQGWEGSQRFRISLGPLPEPETAALLRRLVARGEELAAVHDQLVERCGGNPLFLQEMVRVLGSSGAAVLGTLPPTIQAIVSARVDRLPAEDKQLLQAAAVIGLEFHASSLARMLSLDLDLVRARLVRLQAGGFVQERQIFPELAFGFKHTLLLEVINRGLLKARKRELHRCAFNVLRSDIGQDPAGYVRLARHASEGELWDEAIRFGRLAARRSASFSAYQEAASLYRQALASLSKVPNEDQRRAEAIDLKIELRHVLFPLGDFAAIGELLEEARLAAEAMGDRERLAVVLSLQMTQALGAGRHADAIRVGKVALEANGGAAESPLVQDVLFQLIQANASAGNYREAVGCARRLLARTDGAPATVQSLTHMWLAWCLGELGCFLDAHEQVEAGFAAAARSEQMLPLLHAHLARGLVLLREERFREAAVWLEGAFQMSQRPALRAWWPAVGSPLGRVWAELDRTKDAVELLEHVVSQTAANRGTGHVLRAVHLGEAYLKAGRTAEAKRIATHALEVASANGELSHLAYAHLLLAGIAVATQKLETARQHAQAAADLSRELEMRPLQHRAQRLLSELPVLRPDLPMANTRAAADLSCKD